MQEKQRDRNVHKNVHKITVYVTYDEIVDIIFLPQREFVISIRKRKADARTVKVLDLISEEVSAHVVPASLYLFPEMARANYF